MKSSPQEPKLEKARVQQGRPSKAKNKRIKIKKDTCTPMFIAASLTIAKTCKQSKFH